MPYPNFHACRLREPGEFDKESFRNISREHDGKTYEIIMGKLKGQDTMTEQAYRYPKDTWSADAAQSHCKAHDGKTFEAARTAESTQHTSVVETITTLSYNKDAGEWPIVIARCGLGTNGHNYSLEVLTAAAPRYVGLPVLDGHALDTLQHGNAFRPASHVIGMIKEARVDPTYIDPVFHTTGALLGTLKITNPNMRAQCEDPDYRQTIGFSHVAKVFYETNMMGGKRVLNALDIIPNSVDMVIGREAAQGGRFLEANLNNIDITELGPTNEIGSAQVQLEVEKMAETNERLAALELGLNKQAEELRVFRAVETATGALAIAPDLPMPSRQRIIESVKYAVASCDSVNPTEVVSEAIARERKYLTDLGVAPEAQHSKTAESQMPTQLSSFAAEIANLVMPSIPIQLSK